MIKIIEQLTSKIFIFKFYKYILYIIFTFIPVYSYSEVNIIDADTLKLNEKIIRLSGIDAPESTQTCENFDNIEYDCGAYATDALRTLIKLNKDKEVNCNYTNKDKFGRFIGVCYIGNLNINSWLVKKGWALAYKQYSIDYIIEENRAKIKNAGIWNGKFIEPWEWRKGKRLKPKSNKLKDYCIIKGNISSKGERIYHIKGSKHFNQTKISPEKGERWFCSEKEAIDNGWRKSKR